MAGDAVNKAMLAQLAVNAVTPVPALVSPPLPKLSDAQWTVTQHAEQLTFENFVGTIQSTGKDWGWCVRPFGGSDMAFQNAEGRAKTEVLARDAVFSIIGCALLMREQNR